MCVFLGLFRTAIRNTGVLSHKLRNSTHWGELSPFTYVLYQDIRVFSPTPSSPVYQLDGTYFYRSRALVFRVGYTISINVSTWRFGAAVRKTSKKPRWRRCSWQHVRICDSVCSNGLRSFITVVKSHHERISHLYDIEILIQIVWSLIALPPTNYF